MDPAGILIVTSMILLFLTLLGISYKTDFVSYSIWSLTRRDQPRFQIKKEAVGKFVWITVAVFLLNVVYGLLVMRDMSQAGAVLVLSLFNTIVVGYGLSFWVLLAEKKPITTHCWDGPVLGILRIKENSYAIAA